MSKYRGKHEPGRLGNNEDAVPAGDGQNCPEQETAGDVTGGDSIGEPAEETSAAAEPEFAGEEAAEETGADIEDSSEAEENAAQDGDLPEDTAETPEKKKKIRLTKKAKIILIIILAVAFLASAGILIYRLFVLGDEKQALDDLATQVTATDDGSEQKAEVDEGPKYDENGILMKYSELYKQNNDMAGWVYIEGTNVNYPVMYTPDDMEFYIHRGFDTEYAFSGLPFIDSSCDPFAPTANIIMYGHKMNNGTMFSDLLKYADESYYKDHQIIQFDTLYKEQKYQIIAACYTRVLQQDESGFRYYTFFDASSEDEFNDYVDNVKACAGYDTGVTAQYGDELITLSTCSYHVTEGRFIVVAKKIAETSQEK